MSETSPEATGTIHQADDVTNEPTGAVEQSGPVTYHADHVPEDAPVLVGKVVQPPAKADPKTGPKAATK